MEEKRTDIRQIERDNASHGSSNEEKGTAPANPYPLSDDDKQVTFKTWIVVTILASAYGVSFWIVPAIAIIGSQVATKLDGAPSAAAGWFTSLYTVCNAIAFMICGANSDLFGRRWFLIMGNVLLLVGHIMCGVAKNSMEIIQQVWLKRQK